MSGANQRRYALIYFPEGGIGGVVAGSDSPGPVQVLVLNLSEGGIFFTIPREDGRKLQETGGLLLLGLNGPPPFRFAEHVALEVRWVFDEASMERIGFGCEFSDPPPASLNLIRAMIKDFLAGRVPPYGAEGQEKGGGARGARGTSEDAPLPGPA